MVTNGLTTTDTAAIVATPIPVALLDPSRLNRHCSDTDPDIAELANTIHENGLLAPISARPMESGRYEIICGERRWRAFRLLELETIPCIVKDLDDTQAQIERIVENYQRRDPSFMEQGEAVAALMELTNRDVEEIANRLGQSVSWVRRRSRLPNLIPAWREELDKPNTHYAEIKKAVGKIEEIAILPANTQQMLLDKNVLRYVSTIKEIRKTIAKFFMDLDSKPWTREWEKKAFSGSGKKRCDACQRRSDREGVLFDNPDTPCSGKKMCLDPECWKNKCLSWSKHLMTNNPDMIPILRGYAYGNDCKNISEFFGVTPLPYWNWKERDAESEEKRDGYSPAIGVFVDGSEIGTTKTIWIDYPDGDAQDDEDENADGESFQSWRKRQAEDYQKKELFTELVRTEVAAYLADIDTHATITPGELATRQIRATFWFGVRGYMYNDNRIDDPEWHPLATAWEQTSNRIAEIVSIMAMEDISEEYHEDFTEAERETAKMLCTMFNIPFDLITTKALDQLGEASSIDDGTENNAEATETDSTIDERNTIYFLATPGETHTIDYPLQPISAQYSPVV